MESPRLKTFEIILLIAVVVGGGVWLIRKPGQVVQQSPMPTASQSEWSSTDISWQDFKNKYGFQITIPSDWMTKCIEGTNTDCIFQSPKDIAAEKQWNNESETRPFTSLIIELFDERPTAPVLQKELGKITIGTSVFDKYQVFGFGDVYGIAHGDHYFQFDALSDNNMQILFTFKFTK